MSENRIVEGLQEAVQLAKADALQRAYVAALTALQRHPGMRCDQLEVLVGGDGRGTIPPGALKAAVAAALGDDAANLALIMPALHQFARDTSAPAGENVFTWFADHTDTLRARWSVQDDLFAKVQAGEARIRALEAGLAAVRLSDDGKSLSIVLPGGGGFYTWKADHTSTIAVEISNRFGALLAEALSGRPIEAEKVISGRLLQQAFADTQECGGWTEPFAWDDFDSEQQARWGRAADQLATLLAITPSLQARVHPWMMACFGAEIASDRLERNDRFIEEALELVQASGYPRERALQLVDYVYGRPQGEINQEVGGVMITLAAHCLAHGVDMHEAGETELARIWTKVEQIREKQKAKPKGSALPIPQAARAEA